MLPVSFQIALEGQTDGQMGRLSGPSEPSSLYTFASWPDLDDFDEGEGLVGWRGWLDGFAAGWEEKKSAVSTVKQRVEKKKLRLVGVF